MCGCDECNGETIVVEYIRIYIYITLDLGKLHETVPIYMKWYMNSQG